MSTAYEFTPIEELRYSAESLSDIMLSTVSTAAGIAQRMAAMMPNIVSGFMSTKLILGKMNEKSNNINDVLHDITADQQEFLWALDDIGFTSVRELKAWQPEGVNVPYMTYLDVLVKYTKSYMDIEKSVIDPYLQFLAQIVSNPKALMSTDSGHVSFVRDEKSRDAMFAEFSKLYDKNSFKSQVTIKDVVDRNADWVPVFTLLKNCNNNMTSIGRDSIMGKVQQAATYLDIIKKNLDTNKLDTATAEVATKLSEGAYNVASELQAMATVYYRVLAISGSIKNTMDHVKKINT